MRIGIAGTGRMGTAIGQRLLSQGHEVAVWNRTRARTRTLEEAGATVVDQASDLPANVEAVISIVTDGSALDDIYLGDDGLLARNAAGCLFIEMSTVRPDDVRRIAAAVMAANAFMIECPVGGTTGPAKEGKLFGFVGGEPADVGRARPILEALCRRIEHVGPIGSGAALKLAINLPLIAFWQSFGEALALCRSLDMSGERLVDIFADTSGGPNVLKARASVVAGAIDGHVPAGTFDVDSMRKDLRTMLSEAGTHGKDLPVARRVLECLDECSAAGLGDRDGSAASVFWRDRSSTG